MNQIVRNQEASVSVQAMTRKDRLLRWASLIEGGNAEHSALTGLEFLGPRELQTATNGMLKAAAADPVFKALGLEGETMGDAMKFFDLNDQQAHHALCDCIGGDKRSVTNRIRALAEGALT